MINKLKLFFKRGGVLDLTGILKFVKKVDVGKEDDEVKGPYWLRILNTESNKTIKWTRNSSTNVYSNLTFNNIVKGTVNYVYITLLNSSNRFLAGEFTSFGTAGGSITMNANQVYIIGTYDTMTKLINAFKEDIIYETNYKP